MQGFTEIVRNIGIDPFVAGVTAIITIFAAAVSTVRWIRGAYRRPDARDGKTRRIIRGANRDMHRLPPQRGVSPRSARLLYFLGARMSGLAILLGAIIMYHAMTAPDRLRAEMGHNPPVEILYSTAFSATLELIFGIAVLLIAVGSAQRLKNWASSEALRPKDRRSRKVSRP